MMFQTKSIHDRNHHWKQRYFIMVKGQSIRKKKHKYYKQNRAPKHMKQKLTKLKGKTKVSVLKISTELT